MDLIVERRPSFQELLGFLLDLCDLHCFYFLCNLSSILKSSLTPRMKTTRRTISRHISLPKKPRTVEIPADLAYINHPQSRESNARPMTQFIQSDQMHSPKSFTPQRRDLNSMQEPSSNHTAMQRTNLSNMPIYVVVHAGSILQATTKSILRRTYRIYFLSKIAFFSFNYGKISVVSRLRRHQRDDLC